MQLAVNTFRVINDVAELARREKERITLSDLQYCYTICSLKSKNGYTYYLQPRSTKYKLIADLSDSNKGTGDDYLIVSGNWKFASDDDLHLFLLRQGVFRKDEGKDLVTS